MNNKKNKNTLVAILVTLIAAIFVFLVGFTSKNFNLAQEKYQVYLDGKKIGLIDNADSLYSLINNEQSVIKAKYNVDQIYPPKGFEIEKYISFDNNTSSVEDVYNKIKDEKSFTMKGYTITVSSKATEDNESKVLFRINVLDKQVFNDSIQKIIESFIPADKYSAYMNNTQAEITDVGSMIENVYFQENISIKESYISTEDKIFTDSDELTQYLMFGDNNGIKTYTVEKGDTIASISEANKLNTSEFLIANPEFTNENNMLAVGEKVNISLINPMLSLVYDEYVVEDTEVKYDTDIKYDDTKSSSYKAIETQGQNGIQRVAKRAQVVNGEVSEGAVIDKEHTYMVKDAINEVITRGRKSVSSSGNMGMPVDDGANWAWPTNYPYTLSSPYGWRSGEFHDGQDITGTGFGSPIYAIGSGIVRSAGWGGMVGSDAGYNVVIEHSNGYWSVYAHLSSVSVSVGDTVSRKQRIGAMGKTGRATGFHLHLGVFIGKPYGGGKSINPLTLWK
jgi:murein DD-endopeptidase MepM/ murein hydrolase activator NlpD